MFRHKGVILMKSAKQRNTSAARLTRMIKVVQYINLTYMHLQYCDIETVLW
jgi:hypothetical protein